MEPGCFQWCPVIRPVPLVLNWNTGTSGNTCAVWVANHCHGLPKESPFLEILRSCLDACSWASSTRCPCLSCGWTRRTQSFLQPPPACGSEKREGLAQVLSGTQLALVIQLIVLLKMQKLDYKPSPSSQVCIVKCTPLSSKSFILL